MTVFNVFQNLIVGQSLEGEGAKSNDLVEQDSVAPNIRHRREDPVRKALRGHPPHRQHPAPAEPVVVVLDLTGHPEVRQLDGSAGVDQTVPAGYVSVYISAMIR